MIDRQGKALLTKGGWSIIGDYGELQALLFGAYFATLDLSENERFPIEYGDADPRHSLGVVQNRLDNWVVLADLAGWPLPVLTSLLVTSNLGWEADCRLQDGVGTKAAVQMFPQF